MLSCCSQENWIKGMMPMVNWLLQSGSDAVEVLKRMERAVGTKRLTPHTFKVLEPLVVPEDLRNLTTEMMDETKKPTASRLRNLVKRLLRARWWNWILMNPNVPHENVHESRRMRPCFLLSHPM